MVGFPGLVEDVRVLRHWGRDAAILNSYDYDTIILNWFRVFLTVRNVILVHGRWGA